MGEPEDTIFYLRKVCVFIRVGVAATYTDCLNC